MKRLLFILRSTPYASSKAQEGIDAVLAASVFDQTITILFMDEGIWQLHNHQQSLGIKLETTEEAIEQALKSRKNIAAQIESFPLYDITRIYADRKALKKFSIRKNELILKPTLASDKIIHGLIAENDVVFTY